MSYHNHKKYFEVAYKTGTDTWSHQPTEAEGLKLIHKLPPGASILDIGTGRGYFAKHLAELGFRVIGVDFEPNIIGKAKENIRDWGLEGKLEFIEADALSLPFSDASFDGICDFGLFETLYKEDWPKYISEMSRVLKPGGFYLNVSLSRKTQHFYEFTPIKDQEGEFEKYGIHYHFFEKDEMKNIFAGKFQVISEQTVFSKEKEKTAVLETLFQKPSGATLQSNPKIIK